MKRQRIFAKHQLMIVCFLIAVVFILSSCFFIPWDPLEGYEGEYSDLWTTSIFSVIGMEEHLNNLKVYEKDSQGRVLFGFSYKHTYSQSPDYNKLCFLVIMQKSDDSNAYYYENNYLQYKLDLTVDVSEVDAIEYFDNESIDLLKTANDWNREYDESKMYCSKIVTNKYVTNEREIVNRNYKKIGFYGSINTYQRYFSDNDGNQLYLTTEYYNNSLNVRKYLLIIDKDGQMSYPDGFIEVRDIWNCKEEWEILKSRGIWSH